jgi:hypothetical protein
MPTPVFSLNSFINDAEISNLDLPSVFNSGGNKE